LRFIAGIFPHAIEFATAKMVPVAAREQSWTAECI
jgi:hypothetical protein